MLKLRALQMFNWGYAPYQEPLPVGDITLLRGNNGSGKTTYLTGIALLLGMRRPKHQSIEQFIHPDADWAFIRGLANNQPNEQGLRPFDRVLPASYQDVVTLACLLELKGGRWQRSYYIVPGDFVPEPDQLVDKQHQYTQTDYRKMLAYVGVRDALLRLLEMGLFGVQDISRDPASRFQFFLNLVGDEVIQKRYEEARQTWQEQSQRTLHILDEQNRAEADLSRLEAQVRLAQERRRYKTQLAQAQVLMPYAQVREWRQQMQAQVAAREAANEEIEGLRRQVAANETNRREWRGKYEAFLIAYEAWRTERDKAEQETREAEVSYERAKTLHEQQHTYVERLRALPDITPGAAQGALDEAEARLSEASARLQALAIQRQTLTQEIDRLEQNLPTFPGYVAQFTQALNEAGIPHLLVADAIEVTDRAWLEAVEGRLGGERFTIVVDDERNQIRAKQIGERLRYRHFISPPNPSQSGPVLPHSLWDVVQITDARVTGWVYDLLAYTRRVASVEEGHKLSRRGADTITKDAYLQMMRGGRSVYPRDLVCGRAARQVRLEQARAQLQRLQAEIAQASREQAEARARYQAATDRLNAARERLKLSEAQQRLAGLEAEVAGLQTQVASLRGVYRQSKAREDEFNAQRSEWASQEARLDEESRRLNAELAAAVTRRDSAESMIAQLERDITRKALEPLDEALQLLFDREALSAEQYRQRAQSAQDALDRLPPPEHEQSEEVIEHLYANQKERVEKLRGEVTAMRRREQEYRVLFDEARRDFRVYVESLFNRQMHRAFMALCRQVEARGEINLKGDDHDNWYMEVRVGFHDKPAYPLENAPLSQGQKVMTGLFLVLAALQAVEATPILLLDELMSTLDEINAPIVLQGLRSTGAQCLVATPHIRPQADAVADALWALEPLAEGESYAAPVGVLVRNNGRLG